MSKIELSFQCWLCHCQLVGIYKTDKCTKDTTVERAIETVVEVGLLKQSVIIMMRCPKVEEAKCAQLRSEVIQKVLEAKGNV